MAKSVLTDAYIGINGVAYSNYANSVELSDEADEVEVTGFSTAGYKEYAVGLRDATVTVTFFNDFSGGTASLHSVLSALYTAGGTLALEIRPTSSGAGSANPKATMTSRLYSYSGLAGGVGDASSFDCTFRNAGTSGLVWATS